MTRLREEFDADREHQVFSENQTVTNAMVVLCSECGSRSYCDRNEYDRLKRAFDADMDNQFVCARCIETKEELEH